MSSLRFTKPVQIDGLSEEAAAEFVGLHVGLASAFPRIIGLLQEVSVRRWDKEKEIYRFDEPAPPINLYELADELSDRYMWVSRWSLTEACKYNQPKRELLLAWLESERDKQFEIFAVSEDVAEYLP